MPDQPGGLRRWRRFAPCRIGLGAPLSGGTVPDQLTWQVAALKPGGTAPAELCRPAVVGRVAESSTRDPWRHWNSTMPRSWKAPSWTGTASSKVRPAWRVSSAGPTFTSPDCPPLLRFVQRLVVAFRYWTRKSMYMVPPPGPFGGIEPRMPISGCGLEAQTSTVAHSWRPLRSAGGLDVVSVAPPTGAQTHPISRMLIRAASPPLGLEKISLRFISRPLALPCRSCLRSPTSHPAPDTRR